MNRNQLICRGFRGSERTTSDNKRHNGFTLMELLIVIAIILILMLMAIPTIGNMKRNANKVSALQSIRTIQQMETVYAENFPTNGYACSLSALGGDQGSGAPSPTSAHLIPGDLATGFKSGYIFNITGCTKVSVGGVDRITGYTITAVPQTVGKTGDAGFCADDEGPIKEDPSGATNCTQLVQ